MAGSSTALLAVLDHLPIYSDVASAGVEKGPPRTMKKYAAGSMSISFTSEKMLYGGLRKCGIYVGQVGAASGDVVEW